VSRCALPPLLLCALLAGAILVPSPSFAALPVSPTALAPLPPPPSPPENPTTPEKVDLGKKLFFDRRLSGDGTMKLRHLPRPGKRLRRRPSDLPLLPHHAELAQLPWARERRVPEDALPRRSRGLPRGAGPLPDDEPLRNEPEPRLSRRGAEDGPAYVEAFQAVFGGEITRQRVAMAIAAFERTLLSRDTPLDRHLRGEPGRSRRGSARGLTCSSAKPVARRATTART